MECSCPIARRHVTINTRSRFPLTLRAAPRPTRGKTQKENPKLDANLKLLEQHLNDLSLELELEKPVIEKEEVVEESPEPSAEPQQEQTEEAVPARVPSERPFTIQTFKSKAPASFFGTASFDEVGLSPELQQALKSIDITRPSHIQELTLEAFGEFGTQQSLLVADQSGSGKTLAYLLPLVQKLRLEELEAGEKLTKSKEPRAVVVVPTAELAQQVLEMCRSISKTCPFRAVVVTGGHPWRTQAELLKEGVDVVICTPKRFLAHLETENMTLQNCQTIVLDEVDLLLGEFSDFRESLMQALTFALDSTQFFLATATIPDHTYKLLQETFRQMTFVVGPGLHCTAPGVAEQLVDCSGGDTINEETGLARKLEALSSLIDTEKEATARRTVVFCNKIETCRKVENYLNRKDRKQTHYTVLPYHSAVDAHKRKRNLVTFLQRKETQHHILIATDRASRGLDTSAVSHVILFDFPRDPSEYVRRVGRTARGAQGEGLVSVLVLGRQVQIARNVLNTCQSGRPIHHIPADDA